MSTTIPGNDNPRNGTTENGTLRPPLDPEALHAYLAWLRAEFDKYERVLQALNVPIRSAAKPDKPKNHPRPAQAAAQQTPTIADRVEALLDASGTAPLTLETLKARLRTEYGVRVTPKNLANILNRWVSRGERFTRPAPNTFARKAA